MKTFDFFDTLVTRLIADPRDIFTLVGQKIGVKEFRDIRVAAELRARRTHGGEISFNQIYSEIGLDEPLLKQAKMEEVRLEKGLASLITQNAALFTDSDCIVSDMYYGKEFYLDVLRDLLPNARPGLILISGEMGFNKHSGDMWRFVREHYPNHELHVGDNFESDVRQARRHGLKASHYVSSQLNHAEVMLVASGLDGSMIAGVSRATRLELIGTDTSIENRALIDTFCSIFGPLIFAFSVWLEENCRRHGVNNVYFLARDGKIIYEAFQSLIANRESPIKATYIYTSRQALHLPGFTGIDSAESWLIDDTPSLSLNIIADRGGISINTLIEAAKPLLAVSPAQNLSSEQRKLLPLIIRNPAVLSALKASSVKAYDIARDYFEQEGVLKSTAMALVDIGWQGRMQSSLRSLINKSQADVNHIYGMYVCLNRREFNDSRDSLSGYLAEPPHPYGRPIFDYYRHVLEAAFSADHATTLSYERLEDRVTPRFGEPWSEPMQRRIELQHHVVRTFMRNICKIQDVTGHRIRPPHNSIKKALRSFLLNPSVPQALTFVDFDFAVNQGDDALIKIAKKVPLKNLIISRKNCGTWMEGTLRASGFGDLLKVRRLYHAMRYPARSRS